MGKRRAKGLRLRKSAPVPLPATSDAPARSWYRGSDGAIARDLSAAAIAAAVSAGQGLLWVDLPVGSAATPKLLRDVFRFHPLSIEDTQSAEGRVKVEEFPSYLLVVVRAVRFIEETEDLYDIETFNLWVFVGKNFVVTVHGTHAPAVEATELLLSRSGDLMDRGPGWLMHQVLDATVDAYFPVVTRLDEFVDGLEERVFVAFDEAALRDIFSVKRLVLQLKRHLAPMREVFNVLQSRPSAHITPEAQVYLRDVYDHVIRINESLDSFRDLLASTLDSYLTQVSNRLGRVTKGLTVVATMSVPFVVVSGMWGMNFADIPLAQAPHGFWYMLALQLGLGGALLWVLRRNGWL